MINLNYDRAEHLIKEGYILLFRGKSLISDAIKILGLTPYSHVGVASWSNGNKEPVLELIEYREFKGSRAIALRNVVKQYDGLIDVFAPSQKAERTYYDEESDTIRVKVSFFDGKKITSDFRRYTGLSYSYQRILFLLWFHTPLLRIFTGNKVFNDEASDTPILPVCSTSIAHFFSKHFTDLVKFKSDDYVEPADLARSPLLNYLFTLTI